MQAHSTIQCVLTPELSGFVFLGLWAYACKPLTRSRKAINFPKTIVYEGLLFSTLSLDLVPHVQIVHPRGHLEW